MTYPAGADLVTITYSPPITFLNEAVVAKVTVKPTHTLTWAATGQTFAAFTSVPGATGTPSSFQVPAVDQPGFIDSSGNAFTHWAYTVTLEWSYQGQKISSIKNIQPLAGQGTVNLNTLPDELISLPVAATVPTVLSVDGQTGAVTTSVFRQAAETQKLNRFFALYPENLMDPSYFTYPTYGVITHAPVTWPDGTPGVYDATFINTETVGLTYVDAYTITYGTQVYTQPRMTRYGQTGYIFSRPPVVVS